MRKALLLLAALAGGIVIGYLLGEGGGARDRGARSPAPSEAKPAAARSSTGAADLRQALDAVAIPEPARGDGVVSGRVVNEEGDPMPDVLVLAFPQRYIPTTRDWKPGYDSSLDERVREFAKVQKWRDASLVETWTDSDGRYRLAGLAREYYSVYARREGFQLKAEVRRSFRVRPDATVDFVAHPVIRLRVDVLGPDGAPVQRAIVHCNRKPTWLYAGNPWIELAPGDYTIWGSLYLDQWARSDEEEVTLEVGDEPDPIVLRVRPLPGLRGKVFPPEGLQPAGVGVRLLRFEGEEPPSEASLLREGRTATVGQGMGFDYSFSNLRPGRYLLGATLDHREMAAYKVVEIGEGVLESDLTLPPPDPSEYRRVRVLGPDGAPIRHVEFRYYRVRGDSSQSCDCTSLACADGSSLVRPPEWEREPPGATHVLTAQARTFGLASREIEAEGGSEIVIRFAEPAAVDVTVQGLGNCAFRDRLKAAVVSPFEAETFVLPSKRKSIDASGKLRCAAAQPGPAVVLLLVRRSNDDYVVATSPLELHPGENPVQVQVPPLYTLRISGKSGTRILLRSIDMDRHQRPADQRTLDASGQAAFELLPAGAYELLRFSGGRWQEKISVPAQLEVRVPD